MRRDEIEVLSKGLMQEHVLWQVWGPRGPRDFESGHCFAPRVFPSSENNLEVFPRERFMIPVVQ
jgi:hypothetical protein